MSENGADPAEAYVRGLPEASGEFAGYFDPGTLAEVLPPVSGLIPVEVDTGDSPNPAALGLITVMTFRVGEEAWTFPVDHVDILPGGNRVRIWIRRPEPHDTLAG